jgi:hypothetical protein
MFLPYFCSYCFCCCYFVSKYGRKLATLIGHSHPITSLLLLEPHKDSVEDYFLLTGSSDKQIKVRAVSIS